MLFNVEEDHGFRIRGYLVPDAGGTTPTLLVISEGSEIARVRADVVRPELTASGRHATGLCGFTISEAIIPALSSLVDLELRESETGLAIYRRPQSRFADKKVFRLETHLLPLDKLDAAVRPAFQYQFSSIDKLGLETSLQVFMLANCTSLYASGRVQFQSIEVNLRDFHSVIMMRDPILELAERLIVLRNAPPGGSRLLGERDQLALKPVIDFLRGFKTLDERFCRNLMKRMPENVTKALSNPVTRLLASANPDELPKKNAIAPALQALSCFDVIGIRDDAEAFTASLDAVLELDVPFPDVGEYSNVRRLGSLLKQVGRTELLLEKDLELFEHVRTAHEAAHAHASTPAG